MPVGFPTKVNYATGDVLSATNMNDLSGTVNLLESAAESAAGVNKIINGDFGVWQRGTSFSNPASGAYNADRFLFSFDGTGATRTLSQQTFTPGTAPVAGYEGTYFFRYAQTVAGTSNTQNLLSQKIEDVRTLAGQTATFSFWAKADSARAMTAVVNQDFGSGGSSYVFNAIPAGNFNVTTAWTRFTMSGTVASIAGKTIGTNSNLVIQFQLPAGSTPTLDIWGVQLEAGSNVSPFKTATGTKQGELAACQRYYYRLTPGATYNVFGSGFSNSTTVFLATIPTPVTMRIAPTALEQSGTASQYSIFQGSSGLTCNSVPSLYHGNTNQQVVSFGVASGLTTGQAGIARTDNNTTAFLGWTAEL